MPDDTADAIIRFEDVALQRHGRWALRGARFAVTRGSCVRLDGPPDARGAALQLSAALAVPTQGRVVVAGTDLATLRPRARPAYYRTLGLVLDDCTLINDLSLAANVALAAQAGGSPRGVGVERAHAALDRVGLDAAQSKLPALHAGPGERQLALVARALVNRPVLLLLAAPLRGLAADGARRIVELLDDCVAAGVTVVIGDAPPQAWPKALPLALQGDP